MGPPYIFESVREDSVIPQSETAENFSPEHCGMWLLLILFGETRVFNSTIENKLELYMSATGSKITLN